MTNFFKKFYLRILLIAIGIIIIFAIVYFAFFNKSNTESSLISVKRGDISEIVRVTGKSVADSDADLSFEVQGKVRSVNAKVGDKVKTGEVLVALDTQQLGAEMAIAKAVLDSDRASYEDIKDGTRPEEIIVSEAKLKSAESSLSDANYQLLETLEDAYTKSDDAVKNRVDQLFTNPNTNPQLNLTISDFALEQKVESGRQKMKSTLENIKTTLDSTVESDVLLISSSIRKEVSLVKSFLDDIALLVNSLAVSSSLSQTTIDGYKTSIVTARTNVQTALSAILTAEEKTRSAKTALDVAIENLNLLKAGSTEAQIKIAEAKIKQSEANVQKINVQIEKSFLRAPFSGVVTKQEAKVGEVVSQNTIIMSLIGEGDAKIEAQIPEVDIGRVMVGNDVKITIDAFPGKEYTGKVAYIDPGETIIDGVVNYKSTILFEAGSVDALIRSGLTVNLYIETKSSENTIIIPQFAVLETDEGIFVMKDVNGEKVKTKVELGIRGEEGMLEILSGISEFDKVYNVGLRSNNNE